MESQTKLLEESQKELLVWFWKHLEESRNKFLGDFLEGTPGGITRRTSAEILQRIRGEIPEETTGKNWIKYLKNP